MIRCRLRPVACASVCLLCCSASHAEVTFDFVTITDPGNPAFTAENPFGSGVNSFGRGSVGHEYRIGRTEITTAQWLEYVNTFSTQSDELGSFSLPSFWGAVRDTAYTGPGRRYRLADAPDGAMRGVGGISWREAAMFANWLHNGQSSDPASLESGAYDTSTWGSDGFEFTDAPAHLPGARFWIPTLDEWMKAAFWDPDRAENDGWWLYPNMSDDPPVPGVPGEGETDAGLGEPFVTLGLYPDEVSPWGLLDTSGGYSEWIEEYAGAGDLQVWRGYQGTSYDAGGPLREHAAFLASTSPNLGAPAMGFRVAARVPSPPSIILFASLGALRRRRQQ